MQSGNEQTNNVISLKDRASNSQASPAPQASAAKEEFSWEETMRRNAENSSRQKGDREKSNKGVIRSYRLKH